MRNQQPRPKTSTRRGKRQATNPAMLLKANDYRGAPPNVHHKAQLVEAFRKSALTLRIPRDVRDLILTLAEHTYPQDWKASSRPIVWESNDNLAKDLEVTPGSVSRTIARAIKAGVLFAKDNGSRKRYGARDEHGTIILQRSFGLDLSPLAIRYEEFSAIVADIKQTKRAHRAIYQNIRATLAELQTLAAAAESSGLWTSYWDNVLTTITAAARQTKRQRDIELDPAKSLLADLSAKTRDARQALATATNNPTVSMPNSMHTMVHTDDDQIKLQVHPPIVSEVVELPEEEGCKNPAFVPAPPAPAPAQPSYGSSPARPISTHRCEPSSRSASGFRPTVSATPRPTAAQHRQASRGTRSSKVTPQNLAAIAPVIAGQLSEPPTWRNIDVAISRLAPCYRISAKTWASARREVGTERAIMIFTIMTALPPTHFTKGPGAWFVGTVNRAAAGHADLMATYYGAVDRAAAGEANSLAPSSHGTGPQTSLHFVNVGRLLPLAHADPTGDGN